MRSRVLALLCLVMVLVMPRPPVEADDGLPIDMAEPDECFGAVPHLPLDPTRGTITSNVVIARDGVSEKTARSLMAKVGKIYAATAGPHPVLTPDVRFRIVAVHDLRKVLKGRTVNGFYTEPKPTEPDLMAQMIRHYNTKYPKLKRHHVHLFTNRDLTQEPVGDVIAGIANCIGGIGTRYGYSISEVGRQKPIEVGPLIAFRDVDVKTAAHEIGHIFGAHHHYANCVEEAVNGLLASTTDICTLMFNAADLAASKFGVAEVMAIRGYAEAHIAGTNPIGVLPLPELPPLP